MGGRTRPHLGLFTPAGLGQGAPLCPARGPTTAFHGELGSGDWTASRGPGVSGEPRPSREARAEMPPLFCQLRGQHRASLSSGFPSSLPCLGSHHHAHPALCTVDPQSGRNMSRKEGGRLREATFQPRDSSARPASPPACGSASGGGTVPPGLTWGWCPCGLLAGSATFLPPCAFKAPGDSGRPLGKLQRLSSCCPRGGASEPRARPGPRPLRQRCPSTWGPPTPGVYPR